MLIQKRFFDMSGNLYHRDFQELEKCPSDYGMADTVVRHEIIHCPVCFHIHNVVLREDYGPLIEVYCSDCGSLSETHI